MREVIKPFFVREFPSTLESMAAPLREALQALSARGWVDASHPFHARLCLEEALVNAIVHGNQGDAARQVRIEIAEEGNQCLIRVCDEGSGFSVESCTMPHWDEEGGRGVCLMKHCMDQVTYDKDQHCLIMKMRRPVGEGVPKHEQPE